MINGAVPTRKCRRCMTGPHAGRSGFLHPSWPKGLVRPLAISRANGAWSITERNERVGRHKRKMIPYGTKIEGPGSTCELWGQVNDLQCYKYAILAIMQSMLANPISDLTNVHRILPTSVFIYDDICETISRLHIKRSSSKWSMVIVAVFIETFSQFTS